MNPTAKARLSAQVQKLLDNGKVVISTQSSSARQGFPDMYGPNVEPQAFHRWHIGCQSVARTIGDAAQLWIDAFSQTFHSRLSATVVIFGKLEALKDAVDNDLLTRVEDLVTADAFGSLLEQANELFEKKFTLAAGVLGRAVLEEHLRKLCDRHQCLLADRPTIGDLNQALYAGKHLDKIAMHQVTAMAAPGNHCAHNNQPELSAAEVRKLLDDVQDFLVRNPLP